MSTVNYFFQLEMVPVQTVEMDLHETVQNGQVNSKQPKVLPRVTSSRENTSLG